MATTASGLEKTLRFTDDFLVTKKHSGTVPKLTGDSTDFLNGNGEFSTPSGVVPSAHHTTHENGGSDEINVAGLSGQLADPQPALGTAAVDYLDSVFRVVDDGTPSKKLAFECSGIGAGNTRTMTVPDRSSTIMTLDGTQVMTGNLTLPSSFVSFQCDDVVTLSGNGGLFGGVKDLQSGEFLPFYVVGSAFSAGTGTLDFPSEGGSVLTTDSAATVNSKIFSNAGGAFQNQLRCSTVSAGVCFADNSTTTKRLRMVLSGASANNHSFTLTNSGARNYGFGNLSGNVVVVGDDPPAVAAGALGKVDLTAQTADIGTTNLSSTPPAGIYEVEIYLMCTTAAAAAGTLTVTIGWTDNVGATTDATTITAFPLTATGRAKAIYGPLRVNSGDITYAVAVTGIYSTAAYAIYARVVSLG